VNQSAIITRLKLVLEHYELTSSTFADSIAVQRSSISHLMSGRNKPSLDFVMKVVTKYPEVDFYWLLNGEGSFPKATKKSKTTTTPMKDASKQNSLTFSTPSLFDENEPNDIVEEKKINTRFSANEKKLIKVVLLYEDGTFEAYNA